MIIATRSGREVESRAFALSDMVRWGYQGLRNLQTQAGELEARGIPALARAIRLRAEAIACLRLYCWRGEGVDRERVDTVWQARLFANGPQENATNPVQTRFTFWETVEESMCWHNEAFVWLNSADGRVTDWWALHPAQVIPKFDGTTPFFDVQIAPGFVDPVGRGPGRYQVGQETILHIRGHGQGGQVFADPLISQFREKMAAVLGRQRHEARMWRRGAAIQQAVVLPAGIPKETQDQVRESIRSNYEGTESETTMVIGGGADLKPIGLTPADAQFTAMEDLTVQDAARLVPVPANLLGVPVGTRSRPDLEQDLMEWLRFGLGPELARIEDALFACQLLFGGAQTYPGFDTNDFVRGDILTEATVLNAFVQSGVLLADEARRKLGYPDPLPDGAGKIPQITPVGGAPNALPLPKLAPKAGKQGDPTQNPDDSRALPAKTDRSDLLLEQLDLLRDAQERLAVEKDEQRAITERLLETSLKREIAIEHARLKGRAHV